MKVNLLKERQKAYTINWIEIAVIISVVLFIMAMGVHYYFLYTSSKVLEADLYALDNQIHVLLRRVAEYNRLKAEVEELEALKEAMDKFKYVWAEAIIELGYVIPEQTMVNTLQIEDYNMRLNGFASQNQKVLDFIDNMNESPVYKDIELIDLTQIQDVNYNIIAVIECEEGEE